MSYNEIRVTFMSEEPPKTESMQVETGMSIQELTLLATALLNFETQEEYPGRIHSDQNRGLVQIYKEGQMLYSYPFDGSSSSSHANQLNGQKTVLDAGIKDGDLIYVRRVKVGRSIDTTASNVSDGTMRTTLNGGGLDFSSLLASPNMNSNNNRSFVLSKPSNKGLTFNIPALINASSPSTNYSSTSKLAIVKWKGMTLDEAIRSNPDPKSLCELLLDPSHQVDHGNLLKEMTFHNPWLAKKLKQASSREIAVELWRKELQKSTMNATISRNLQQYKDVEMEQRLQQNPMDPEANAYVGEKIKKDNIEQQYRQMIEEYPESVGRVLMLYIDAEVNGHKIQAFVDSGAQSTIMSSQSAERCGLLHLLDTRFEGVAVGVGTGKILGRVHVVSIRVSGHFFPCSITIMDSEQGSNMDFLLGLDMLKRHRCNIDLARNVLVFNSCRTSEGILETPFLHEKDLLEAKGGTKDFNAEASNMEIDRKIEDMNEKGTKE